MLEEIGNIKNEKSDLRKFGITLGIILMMIAGFLFFNKIESIQMLLTIGIVLFLLSVMIPGVLKPIYWVWMILATIIGWIMTRVILSLLYFLIVTPIGLISRIFGKQFLELKWNKSSNTYWNYRSVSVPEKYKYEKQF